MPDTAVQNQTVLAFDFGLQRLGVAVGQSLTGTAQPLTTLGCRNGAPDWTEIEKLQSEWRADCFVVGLPLNRDGSDHTITVAARKFARELEQRLQRPIYLFDERLSSSSAELLLKAKRQSGERKRRIGKQDIDKTAAAVILQGWLEQRGADARHR